MAPGTKRKAARHADFKKTRQKLGTGKQAASNATDTSFQTKTITLPQQSVSVDRSQQLTTRRNQTLADLAQHARHPSAHMRKDAVGGMLELVTTYPGLAAHETRTLLHPLLPLLADDDASVRRALTAYLGTLLEQLTPAQLAPHVGTLLLFTTSAMSHIAMPVRLDALLVLDALLAHAAPAVTDGWQAALDDDARARDAHGQRVLQAFFAMLGVATDAASVRQGAPAARLGTTASVELQPGGRLRVLRTLAHFLRAATHTEDAAQLPLWCFAPALASASERELLAQLLAAPAPAADAPDVPWVERAHVDLGALAPLSVVDALVVGAAVGHPGAARRAPVEARLAQLLHASLIATLLDAAPAALAPTGAVQNVHLELVAEILDLAVVLWRAIITEHVAARGAQGQDTPVPALAQLDQLLAHLAPYFPASGTGAPLLPLNAAYCELVALRVMARADDARAPPRTARPMERTLAFLVAQLDAPDAWTPALYVSLVPTFWLLLSAPHMHADAGLMDALLRHYAALATTSALQPLAFAFLARLALLHTFRSLRVPLDAVHGARDAWQAWLTALPRTVWEAAAHAASRKGSAESRARCEALAHAQLAFLHTVLLQADGVLFDHATRDALRAPLAPLFAVRHPTRGPIAGPYARLPPPTQAVARALAAHAGVPLTA